MKKEVVKDGVHSYTQEDSYVPPKEKEVQEHLKWFMGLKLGTGRQGYPVLWDNACRLYIWESSLCKESDGERDQRVL